MAVIHNLTNLGSCGVNGFAGTNNDFCKFDVNRIKKVLRMPYNYKFPSDFEFTLDNLLTLQQEGKIVPLYTIVNASFTTEDNGIETFGGGKKQLIEKMPIQIEGKMINGIQGYQNTLTIEKAPAHSFLIVDVNNNIFGFKGKDGLFGGINSEFLQVMPYVGSGDASPGYMIQFQLDRNAFDTGLVVIQNSDYDFEIDDVRGVTNLEITIPVTPVVGGTSVSFKVVRKEDNAPQLGLSADELSISVGGVVVSTPTIVEGVGGNYSVTGLTAFTLGQVIAIQTKGAGTITANLDGVLLKSNNATTVVVSA